MMIYRLSMLKWLQNQGKLDNAKTTKIMEEEEEEEEEEEIS